MDRPWLDPASAHTLDVKDMPPTGTPEWEEWAQRYLIRLNDEKQRAVVEIENQKLRIAQLENSILTLERQCQAADEWMKRKYKDALKVRMPGSKVRIIEPDLPATITDVVITETGRVVYSLTRWAGDKRVVDLCSADEIEGDDNLLVTVEER